MNDLIDRQAAIDRIEEHLRFGDELYPLTETDKILNHAFEIAASCVYNLPSAQPAPRWIPVTERLPEDGKRVLVTYDLVNKYSWVNILHYGKPMDEDKTCFYASDSEWGDVPYEGIVAWMPLPEPYRKETKDVEVW